MDIDSEDPQRDLVADVLGAFGFTVDRQADGTLHAAPLPLDDPDDEPAPGPGHRKPPCSARR